MEISRLVETTEPYIIEMRRWFHAHPELSLQEQETSKRIQQELKKLEIEYEVLEPGYAIVGTIRGAYPGKTMLLRADIDALAVSEETGLPFTSVYEGRMHACGHDAHIAMLLGAAKILKQLQMQLHGTVKLLFQAAEERGKGVDEVLAYFETHGGPDRVLGLHIWSALSNGELLLLPGTIFSGLIGFECRIHGKGGHGARPDLTHDPLKAACELVLKYAAIPSNFYDVMDHSVVTTGAIQAGDVKSRNVIPNEALVRGTARFFKREAFDALPVIMENIAASIEKMYDVSIELDLSKGPVATVNDDAVVEEVMQIAQQVPGMMISKQKEPISASETFGYLLERYPGAFAVLGAGKAGQEVYPQHNPHFDIDESAMRKGTEYLTRCTLNYLK